MLNIRMRKKLSRPVQLREPYTRKDRDRSNDRML
jgi:hypothetical protein